MLSGSYTKATIKEQFDTKKMLDTDNPIQFDVYNTDDVVQLSYPYMVGSFLATQTHQNHHPCEVKRMNLKLPPLLETHAGLWIKTLQC